MNKLNTYAALIVGLGVFGGAGAETYYDPSTGTVSQHLSRDSAQAADGTSRYWTEERMQEAQPAPMPKRVFPGRELGVRTRPTFFLPEEPPRFTPARAPEREEDPQPSADPQGEFDTREFTPLRDLDSAAQTFGVAPSDPLNGPYGPFQRWSMQGKYLQWPRSIHGKLFFSNGADDFVCSATVIGRSTLATAGHCVSDGAGTMYQDFRFCPSYLQSGENPQVGCWSGEELVTSSNWHSGADFDHDYACIVTLASGTVKDQKVGDVTGWAGIIYNLDVQQPIIQFGYPAAPPFDGTVIQQVSSTEWYEFDTSQTGGQQSKYIGSDLNEGASGGGWFVSWRHPNDSAEFGDTDSSTVTDPFGAQNGPFLNGVNSHQGCIGGCYTPPDQLGGLFWQEMGSPPFLDTVALDEAADVFSVCLAHANNDP